MKTIKLSATMLIVVPLLAINTRGCTRAVPRKPPPVRRPIAAPHLRKNAPAFRGNPQSLPAFHPTDRPFPKPRLDAGEFESHASPSVKAVDEAEKATFGDHVRDAAQDAAGEAASRGLDYLVSESATRPVSGAVVSDAVGKIDEDLCADLHEGDRLMALKDHDRAAAHYRSGMSKAIARYGPGSPSAVVFQVRLTVVMFGLERPAARPPAVPRRAGFNGPE